MSEYANTPALCILRSEQDVQCLLSISYSNCPRTGSLTELKIRLTSYADNPSWDCLSLHPNTGVKGVHNHLWVLEIQPRCIWLKTEHS